MSDEPNEAQIEEVVRRAEVQALARTDVRAIIRKFLPPDDPSDGGAGDREPRHPNDDAPSAAERVEPSG